ncbi:hypothetical protein A2W24_06035 [Microgenomates group bacterium RBG_16_45_19]|nr:MAG: hypothetical protein A2W24_06035 [Microgenomates group bacterium RBG_16_45_19]
MTVYPSPNLRQRCWSYFKPITLLRLNSPRNGLISVRLSYGRCQFLVVGAVQVGGVADRRFHQTLSLCRTLFPHFSPQTGLILGYGGGGLATALMSVWPRLSLTGVDHDPVIVALGQFYLAPPTKVNLVIADAFSWIETNRRPYDLIYLDLFRGFTPPARLTTKPFLTQIKAGLTATGLAIINYYDPAPQSASVIQLSQSATAVFGQVIVRSILENQIFFLTPGKMSEESIQ